MLAASSFGPSLNSGNVLMIIIHAGFSFVTGQIPCHDDNDCPYTTFVCRDHACVCDRSYCDVPKIPGERCSQDIDCFSSDLVCYGKGDVRSCRCRKMLSWEPRYGRCLKDDSYTNSSDPVQNFIIPAIIVMSVGAMIYLGIKLFCNCGKLWRRRQSHLARELEGMTTPSHHQQATWVASYRVFSPLSNASQPPLHPTPCMGLFVPNLSNSPPPYEEALKHKVILSSYHPTVSVPPQLPVYTYEPSTPLEESTPPPPVVATFPRRGRVTAGEERDQTRPLRYYPGEGNPQIPAVWNGVRVTEIEEVHNQNSETSREANMSIFRGNRGNRGHRGTRTNRHHTPEPPAVPSVDTGT